MMSSRKALGLVEAAPFSPLLEGRVMAVSGKSNRRVITLIDKVSRDIIVGKIGEQPVKEAEKAASRMTAKDFTNAVLEKGDEAMQWEWLRRLHGNWYGFRQTAFEELCSRLGMFSPDNCAIHMTSEALSSADELRVASGDGTISPLPTYDGGFALSFDVPCVASVRGKGCDSATARRMTALTVIRRLHQFHLDDCTDSIVVGTLEAYRDDEGSWAFDDAQLR